MNLQRPMNAALIDHYRCPDRFVGLELNGRLSDDAGFFRYGETICYGRSSSGFRTDSPSSASYDVANDVTMECSAVVLPFNPSQVIDNLRLERYADRVTCTARSRWNRALRSAYYTLRPWMHRSVRKNVQRAYLKGWREIGFPRWPVDTAVEDLNKQVLLWSMKVNNVSRVPFVWFWPDGARSCVVMTHDVEQRSGLEFCNKLMDIDDSFGIKASFQLIPEGRYKVSAPLVQAFRDRRFEVNIHDLNHDGRLFWDHQEFLRRAERCNHYGAIYGARGFRSGVLYRNQDWYDSLDFSFDMSVPNVAHLEPQRGGCCTVTPYFIGHILELPVTTTQDYTLFHLLNDFSLDLWITQTDAIVKKNGLVSFIIHPDYVMESRAQKIYLNLLEYLHQLRSSENLWFATPGEVDEWWRARSKMCVIERGGQWRIEGPAAERGKLAFARMVDDRLEYDVEPQKCAA
jgi:hypothetical protein